jgi:hypothetical protein
MSATPNPQGHMPKLLWTHGKHAAKKFGDVGRLYVLFAANFFELADDQFLTDLTWGIAALQEVDDLRARA